MNFQGAISFLVVGIMMLAALFLIIYGAMNGQQHLITIGVGIAGPFLGAVLRQYFPDVVNAIRKKE